MLLFQQMGEEHSRAQHIRQVCVCVCAAFVAAGKEGSDITMSVSGHQNEGKMNNVCC
jgi:hypothetical protein